MRPLLIDIYLNVKLNPRLKGVRFRERPRALPLQCGE